MSTQWWDVGIAPTFISEDVESSATTCKMQRLRLFQRFLYFVLRDIIHASATGVMYEGYPAYGRSSNRNVSTTVENQLIVACSRLSSHAQIARSDTPIRAVRNNLNRVSAIGFPPALAAFEGVGSAPFRLYKSIVFDKLHVLDLGFLRFIPDNTMYRYAQEPYHMRRVS